MAMSTGAENIRWDLSDLFNTIEDKHIATILTEAETASNKFLSGYKSKLKDLTSKELCRAFHELEELLSGLYKVDQYATLLFSIDTGNEQLKAFEAKINETTAKLTNKLVFFDLELGKLSKEQLEKHLTESCLSEFTYYLKRKFETAQYDLSEKEEQLATLKDLTGGTAFYTLYEELVSSFRFEFEVDGEKKILNGDELRALRQHGNKDVRRSAMATFFKRYEENKLVIASCFNNIVKSFNIERELRGYPSAISKRNIGNDLSDEAVAALHNATITSYPLVHRYYELKKKIMNMPDMTLADIYAPMPQADKKYSWEDAKTLVLTSFGQFDHEFKEKAQLMFDQHRIDAPVEPSKRGGAFCSSSIPGISPYVMLNFTGRMRDVSTLAHELGHAIHAMFSEKQNLYNYHSILPLAETASIFSEMILTDYFLKKETDKDIKISLLTTKLEEIFASSHRQNMFSCFELKIHDGIHKKLMSVNELCTSYMEELRKMFGNSVTITDEYKWEWSAIPHMIAYPFYVYSYNFANLLVLALYQQYLEEGKAFVPKFKQLLSYGSSTDPVTITSTVGADITKQAFWEKSLGVIERYIEELEKLI